MTKEKLKKIEKIVAKDFFNKEFMMRKSRLGAQLVEWTLLIISCCSVFEPFSFYFSANSEKESFKVNLTELELELFDTQPAKTRNANFLLSEMRMFPTKSIEKEECISKLKSLDDFFASISTSNMPQDLS